MRELFLLQPRGFCAGVRRAVQSVEQLLDARNVKVSILHELVHNDAVIDSLRRRGVGMVESPEAVEPGGILLFSAHGVSLAVEEECVKRGLHVVDATCPLVKKIHQRLVHLVSDHVRVILIGHAGHREVIGTLGRVENPVERIATVEEALALPPSEGRVAYLTQTTLSPEEIEPLVAVLRKKFPQLEGSGNICYATRNRQEAVRLLKNKCDAVVVVGSKQSSNSRRLREVAERTVGKAFLTDTAGEFKAKDFENLERVAVTSGASTPEDSVARVINRLQSFGFPPPLTIGTPEA